MHIGNGIFYQGQSIMRKHSPATAKLYPEIAERMYWHFASTRGKEVSIPYGLHRSGTFQDAKKWAIELFNQGNK